MLSSHTDAMPVVLGLLAAATWGAADFAGGLATRRAPTSRVVLIAHGVSFVLLAIISWRMPVSLPPWALFGGLLSGLAGGAALMLFYEALSLGAMGLSAAIAGLLTAILPVILAIRSQGAPAPLQIAGFMVAALAIVLIAYAPPTLSSASQGASGQAEPPSRRALLFATLAGAGFGLQLVWLHATAAAGTTAQPLVSAAAAASGSASANGMAPTGSPFAPVVRALLLSRLGGVAIAFITQLISRARYRERPLSTIMEPVTTEPVGRAWMSLPLLAAMAGLLDTAGNGFYMLSSLGGRLDVAAVLSSLYPGATIVLAAVFLRESATRLQALGMGFALVAVALIAM